MAKRRSNHEGSIWQRQDGRWTGAAYVLTTAGTFNGAGVRDYPSLDVGIEATAQTLLRGRGAYGYGAVLDALSSCQHASVTIAAVNASSWCRG